MERVRKALSAFRRLSRRALDRGRNDGALDSLPDWEDLIGRSRGLWDEGLRRAAGGPPVLIATGVPGIPYSTILESVLAAALTLRGARVHVLLCDQVLPACLNVKHSRLAPDRVVTGDFRKKLCDPCVRMGSAFTRLPGIEVHRFGDWIAPPDRATCAARARSVGAAEIPAFREDGLAVGEHAYAGCLRYYSTGSLEGQEHAEEVLRRFFEAALITARVVDALSRAHRFRAACFHHGIYIPQGVVGEVCRARSVRVATWNVAYRKRCFIFSHGDTYHHTLLDEPVTDWKDMTFTDRHDLQIQDYLRSRWKGSQDWIYFHDTPDDRVETLVRETGIDPQRPIIGLLTNVCWDAQLHYRANAFPSMLDWILKTIRWFEGRPGLQLLIRVHPAELRGLQKSRQFVVDEVRKRLPRLPPNVFIIGPESDVNTYAAMKLANAVIIYGTKTGVELASMGIPVIVAGEAWIRNKGLTIDARSEADYFAILDRLPLAESRLSEERAREARKYAYHFFLRRMIPLECLEPLDGTVPYRLAVPSLEALAPGADEGLDVVCDGILEGKPFIYRSEEKPAGIGR